jgi:hypothetical protein
MEKFKNGGAFAAGLIPSSFYPAGTLGAKVMPGKIFIRRNPDKERIGEQSGSKRGKSPTVILIHESAAGWKAFDKGKIPDGGRKITHGALEKKNLGVHFTVDRQGGIEQHGDPLKWRYDHAGGYNAVSVAIEVLNPSRSKLPISEKDGGNFKAVKLGGWYRGYTLILATRVQMEAVWKVCNQLASNISTLKIGFMSVQGKTFTYGNIPNNAENASGIIAHRHVSTHSDASHVELYCYLRATGNGSRQAYAFVMNALVESGKNDKALRKIKVPVAGEPLNVPPVPDGTEKIVSEMGLDYLGV